MSFGRTPVAPASSTWLLFLKYLDALEQDKATEAALDGKKYTHILDKPYRWETWAAPKDKEGKINHNAALTGDDLITFVNGKLYERKHAALEALKKSLLHQAFTGEL
jgi:type I restriction enzyme M protein